MLGFKLRISGVGSIRSTNWATTTALIKDRLLCVRKTLICKVENTAAYHIEPVAPSTADGVPFKTTFSLSEVPIPECEIPTLTQYIVQS